MPHPLLTIIFCILGALIGHLTLKKDRFSIGLGIAIGLTPAFAIAHHSSTYLLAIPVFAALLYWRRHHVLRQPKAA